MNDKCEACIEDMKRWSCKRVSAAREGRRGGHSLVFILMYMFDKPLKTANIYHEPPAMGDFLVA